MKKYLCPCCGFKGLSSLAYSELEEDVLVRGFSPPYFQNFGQPSYEICSCCGYEFGNDDEPGTGNPTAFEHHLKNWIDDGCKWFNPSERPISWNLAIQLDSAPVKLPSP